MSTPTSAVRLWSYHKDNITPLEERRKSHTHPIMGGCDPTLAFHLRYVLK